MAFGILGMTNGLGSLVGGLGVGYAANQLGFRGVFEGIAVFCALIVVGGLLSVESPAPPTEAVPAAATPPAVRPSGALSVGLVLLLAAQLLLSVANSTSTLGRSLSMDQHGFSKLTINLTQSVSGVVGLALTLVLGWLSDRIGRRSIMIGSFLLTAGALLVLAVSAALWEFYLFAGLIAFLAVPGTVGTAYVMDVVPREAVPRGVSLFQAAAWAGNIAGMAATGMVIGRLGVSSPILYSALLPVVGIVFLLFIRRQPSAAISAAPR